MVYSDAENPDERTYSQLALILFHEISKGKSIRSLARDMDMSDSTLRRVIAGEDVHPSTLAKVAYYLHLPEDKVFAMHRTKDPLTVRTLLQAKFDEITAKLPVEDQEYLLSMAQKMLELRSE